MPGTNSLLGGGGFHHVALKVHNFDRSLHLYTSLFGFKEKIRWGEKTPTQDTRAIMLDTGDGNYLELFAGGPPPKDNPDGPMIHMAFRCSNVDESITRIRNAGLTITIEPKLVDIPSTPPTPVRLAFCKGPDNEIIELFDNQIT